MSLFVAGAGNRGLAVNYGSSIKGNFPVARERAPIFEYNAASELFRENEEGLWLDPNDMNSAKVNWRRNLLTYSEQFDNIAWQKAQASITANATAAPDGTITADKLVEDNTTNNHRVARGITIPANSTCTLSFYAKASERTWAMAYLYATGGLFAFFDLANGVVGDSSVTASITEVGNTNTHGQYSTAISSLTIYV